MRLLGAGFSLEVATVNVYFIHILYIEKLFDVSFIVREDVVNCSVLA